MNEASSLQSYYIKIIYTHLSYRLILTAVLLASKFFNDVFFGNHFVAYVGGIHLQELNQLEVEFVRLLGWKLWVDPEEYALYLKNLNFHFE